LPYGRQCIEADDVAAVVAALTSGTIAHGPQVAEFEREFAAAVGAREAVAVSSGTAALHVALAALDVGPGDLCLVPAVTFLATATAGRLLGADIVFTDVDPDSGLMTAQTLDRAWPRAGPVKAALPVHLGGRLCALDGLAAVVQARGGALVEDASHAVGGVYADGSPVGACRLSQAATFSFHPVKTLAAGEGGMVTCNDAARAERMRRLRNHGVTHDPALMSEAHSLQPDGRRTPWAYEQIELGFNYRMNELEAALGRSQLTKLKRFVARRLDLSDRYDAALKPLAPAVRPAPRGLGAPGFHLYVALIDFEALDVSRSEVMTRLQAQGVASQVHYIPLYRQPYFRRLYGDQPLPGAEAYYARALALPLFPAMALEDVDRAADALSSALRR
jgi:UDP-4-amino-4,6-dideoxy-N-acetyl-beta-L-altrosamine transaminase